MRPEPATGFTLIELVVALAVAAILLGVGVPSFTAMVRDGRMRSAATELNLALYLARSEAVKRAGTAGVRAVTVCARAGDDACSADPGDWENGWIVFADTDLVPGAADAEIGPADTILRVSGPVHERIDVASSFSTDRTAASAAPRSHVSYRNSGRTDWENGTLALCDDREPVRWQALNVSLTGDVRRARPNAARDALVDAFGRDIDACA